MPEESGGGGESRPLYPMKILEILIGLMAQLAMVIAKAVIALTFKLAFAFGSAVAAVIRRWWSPPPAKLKRLKKRRRRWA